MGEQKEMVIKSKPDFYNIKKASKKKMMGMITEFHIDWRRQGMFILDGIVRQVNLLSVSLTNKDWCGRK